MFITVGEFIKDVRENLEDQTGDILTTSIMAYLRSSLSRLAREPGLEDLFMYHDTLELGRMKEDGSPAAVWTINGVKEDNGEGRPIGQIINVKSLLILKTTDCNVRQVTPCYLPYKYFRQEHPFPECLPPGDPCFFTIEQFQGTTKIMFDRPIKSERDILRIPVDYEDLLIELVKTLYYEGTSDFASSRAVEDKIDYLVAQIREQLHRNPDALPLRTVNRSY